VRVLVVEDQPKLRSLLTRALRAETYAVDAVADGVEGLHQATEVDYDAVVLDIVLPGMDGLALLRELRERDRWMPVLLLTARDQVSDRVRGLDAGADDYLTKPFALAELLSRLRALVRRASGERPAALTAGPVRLDPATHVVSVSAQPVHLSPREFAILEYLLRRQGEVVSRTELLDHVWDGEYDGVSNVVDVYVKYLRDKIDRRHGLALVQTVRGVGYRIGDPT